MATIKLKDITVNLFAQLTTDEKLLELMEVPCQTRNGKKVYKMDDLKKQFLEEKNPGDLVDTDHTRLCIYELPTTKSRFSILEQSYIQIDIYVTKRKNVRDRRTLMIADRLRQILNNGHIFDIDVHYYNRNPNLEASHNEWSKYGVTFSYNNISL